MRELLTEIWTSVRRNKLRTILTGFSVAWGIFMLVILLGSGNGLKNGVMANFGDYAINSIDLYGGRTSKPFAGYEKGRRIRMRNSDLDMLTGEFPEIREIAANMWLSQKTASYGNRFMKTGLRACLPKVARIEGIKLASGRFINEMDIERRRKVIVIDEAMQRVLFDGRNPLGKKLRLGDTLATSVFTVVGVEKGDADRPTAYCYMPLTTGQLIYKQNDPEVNNALFTIEGIDTDAEMQEFENASSHGWLRNTGSIPRTKAPSGWRTAWRCTRTWPWSSAASTSSSGSSDWVRCWRASWASATSCSLRLRSAPPNSASARRWAPVLRRSSA